MASTFDEAVLVVLLHEGGYVFDPRDPGGETNFGISKRQYPNVDIKNLTIASAIAIYRRDYWNPLYEQITHQSIADKIMDMGVNLGVASAVQLVQLAVGATVDGNFGPKTLAAVNVSIEHRPGFLLRELRGQQCAHYATIFGAKSPFLLGLMRRGCSV